MTLTAPEHLKGRMHGPSAPKAERDRWISDRYKDGFLRKQIAHALGITEGPVEKVLGRSKAKRPTIARIQHVISHRRLNVGRATTTLDKLTPAEKQRLLDTCANEGVTVLEVLVSAFAGREIRLPK